ncbi:LasU family protein [Lactiplantibacillus plantarum]|uniref:LasU family protein n=1 Tax=Lactiplantibacillus plantarum TaxID=1590 RepID=UPI001FB89DE4|nr:LasU family protein [Lactiplantibacillus plantarum]
MIVKRFRLTRFLFVSRCASYADLRGWVPIAWTAYAFTLLILYTILATFITSMADAYQGNHGRTVPEKQFYWYMCTLSVILTILAIYWMAHN